MVLYAGEQVVEKGAVYSLKIQHQLLKQLQNVQMKQLLLLKLLQFWQTKTVSIIRPLLRHLVTVAGSTLRVSTLDMKAFLEVPSVPSCQMVHQLTFRVWIINLKLQEGPTNLKVLIGLITHAMWTLLI